MHATRSKGEAAGDRGQTKWAQHRADAASKVGDVKAKIDARNTEIDAKIAALADRSFAQRSRLPSPW